MPRTYSSVPITAGAGTPIDTVQTSLDADQRQIVVLGDPDTDTQLQAIDASGRAQVAVSPAAIVNSTTSIAVATPANTPALNVTNAGTVTFIVKNTVAASAWAGAPVLVFEQSDDSTSWAPLLVLRGDNNSVASTCTLSVGAANSEIMFDASIEGVNWVRVRCTTAPITNALTIVIQPDGGFVEPYSLTLNQPSMVGTSSSVAASATVVTLLAANGNRLGYTVFNDSTSALYLLNGSGASLTACTLPIPAYGYYECPVIAGRGYAGIVTGIWTSAIGNARLVEHT